MDGGRDRQDAGRGGPGGGPGRWLRLALMLWPLLAGPATGAELVGKPRVIDGNTLDFSGRIVRLYGIDAPDREQTCRAGGKSWACGLEARWAVINRLGRHWVTCVDKGKDRQGRNLAVCYLAGIGQLDLNAWLVSRGWALADPTVARDYLAEEDAARRRRKGLWRGEFVPPADWRRGRRLAP
ncbi:MAG: thermonuclease family protein [Kiloniellaceae bacterium]